MTPKRHPVRKYDKRFKARGKGRSYTFTGVPASLANAVRDKARRNGDSVRSLVLEALAAYAEWTPASADEEPTSAEQHLASCQLLDGVWFCAADCDHHVVRDLEAENA